MGENRAKGNLEDRKWKWIGHILRQENDRLRAFENRVLRRIFGPKRDEVTGE
jgi:hypothetical protein